VSRANRANAEEALELVVLALDPTRRQYAQGVKLYTWALAAKPALADDPTNYCRYNAACCAALTAAGKDKESPKTGAAEKDRLNGLALKWLRAELTQITSLAKDAKQHPQIAQRLTHLKADADLASVRDPAALAAMSPADRKAWGALWRDVDALFASIAQRAGPPPAKP
jgi:hypothetical protein